jgi:hypothetical protein
MMIEHSLQVFDRLLVLGIDFGLLGRYKFLNLILTLILLQLSLIDSLDCHLKSTLDLLDLLLALLLPILVLLESINEGLDHDLSIF